MKRLPLLTLNLLSGLLFVALGAGLVQAQSSPAGVTSGPDAAAIAKAYPLEARKMRVGGLVTLTCTANADRTVSDCLVKSEAPQGLGFGAAALSLASEFRTDASASNSVDIPVRFDAQVGKPHWEEIPTGDQIVRYYPPRAQAARISGKAFITCKVTAEGRLEGCQTVYETPEGMGFGEAALSLAQYFKMAKKTSAGDSVAGGTVRSPIFFDIAGVSVR